jgi:hypothetical protein
LNSNKYDAQVFSVVVVVVVVVVFVE